MEKQIRYIGFVIIIPGNPSRKLIRISLAANLLFCITVLPVLLQKGSSYSLLQLLDTLFWQILSLFGWPIVLSVGILNFIISGALPDPATVFSISIYPLIWLAVILLAFSKKGKWISVIMVHVLLVLSFIATWYPVFTGYTFMVG